MEIYIPSIVLVLFVGGGLYFAFRKRDTTFDPFSMYFRYKAEKMAQEAIAEACAKHEKALGRIP